MLGNIGTAIPDFWEEFFVSRSKLISCGCSFPILHSFNVGRRHILGGFCIIKRHTNTPNIIVDIFTFFLVILLFLFKVQTCWIPNVIINQGMKVTLFGLGYLRDVRGHFCVSLVQVVLDHHHLLLLRLRLLVLVNTLEGFRLLAVDYWRSHTTLFFLE